MRLEKKHTSTLHFKFIKAQQSYYNPFRLFRDNFILCALQVPPFQLMISYFISLRWQNFLMLLPPKLQNHGHLKSPSPSSPITMEKVSFLYGSPVLSHVLYTPCPHTYLRTLHLQLDPFPLYHNLSQIAGDNANFYCFLGGKVAIPAKIK